MVCRDKEIQTILGCLITSRIRQDSELLVIMGVEANPFPCISSSVEQVCVDTFSWCLYLCTSSAATNTFPMSLCLCVCLGGAGPAGRKHS